MEEVIGDFQAGKLRKVYDFFDNRPPTEWIGPARRDILQRDLYNYKGVQMVDLVHASRGCRFNCYPCCVSFLGGRQFRPRPIDRVVEEIAGIDNNRLFVVDNSSPGQQMGKGPLSRPDPPQEELVLPPHRGRPGDPGPGRPGGGLVRLPGCLRHLRHHRERIRRYHDHGIGVEGTILLGLDDHTEDGIKRLIDFLMEIELDLAEFTVLTPFPHTRTFDDLHREGRILSYDWNDYTADKVVFQPRNMPPEKLQELFHYAWDTFYRDEPQSYKMFKLLKKVSEKEHRDGTYRRRRRDLMASRFRTPRGGRRGGSPTKG